MTISQKQNKYRIGYCRTTKKLRTVKSDEVKKTASKLHGGRKSHELSEKLWLHLNYIFEKKSSGFTIIETC